MLHLLQVVLAQAIGPAEAVDTAISATNQALSGAGGGMAGTTLVLLFDRGLRAYENHKKQDQERRSEKERQEREEAKRVAEQSQREQDMAAKWETRATVKAQGEKMSEIAATQQRFASETSVNQQRTVAAIESLGERLARMEARLEARP